MTTLTDWRQRDTPEFRAAAGAAQSRLDYLDYGPDYTPEQAEDDRKLTDRYDRLVLQPAQYEYDRQCAEDEFEHAWPEPGDGARIEWGEDIRWAAYRDDANEDDGRHWFMYNDRRGPGHTWAELVREHAEAMYSIHDITILAETQS